MKKTALWQDIRQSFTGSWGRFFSIMGLMLLGSYALVGLYVTGPDMRVTGTDYFQKHNTADISVIADYGLDQNDVMTIKKAPGLRQAEFGYLKDVVVKGTHTSIRIFSAPQKVSQYALVAGRMPRRATEIVLNSAEQQHYHVGQTFKVTEKADALGSTVLRRHTFTIVGFVNSSELISDVNIGQSAAGTGSLNGFAVVPASAFRSDYYMLARLTYRNTKGIDPYSQTYTDRLAVHKTQLKTLLKNQPAKRLAAIKEQAQAKIDAGQKRIDSAKQKLAATRQQLTAAKSQIAAANTQINTQQTALTDQVASAQQQIAAGTQQLAAARTAFVAAQQQLAGAQTQLATGQAALDQNWQTLQTSQARLTRAAQQLAQAQTRLTAGGQAISQAKTQLTAGYQTVNANQEKINAAQAQITASASALAQQKALLDAKEADYQQNADTFKTRLAEWTNAHDALTAQQSALTQKKNQLANGKDQYEAALTQWQGQIAALDQQLANPDLAAEERAALTSERTAAQAKLTSTQTAYDHFMTSDYTPGMAEAATAQDKIDAASQTLAAEKSQLDESQAALQAAQQTLAASQQHYTAAAAELSAARTVLAQNVAALAQAKDHLAAGEKALAAQQDALTAGQAQYVQGQAAYASGQQQYTTGLQAWLTGAAVLRGKQADYAQNAAKINQAQATLQSQTNALTTAQNTLTAKKSAGEAQLAAAKQQLSAKEKQYTTSLKQFQEARPAAEQKIADAESSLREAKATLSHLALPVYARDSRREIPGGDGYKIYGTISWIVDALAAVFPIFLYFVAALVTVTTMTRFVDEERINSGTLKALGYDDADIIKKFTIYGAAASLVGTVLGVALGHTLLPYIVYNAYRIGFTLPPIELHIHWGVTLIAFFLAFLSAVVPAYWVARRELQDRPADLLLPKPPAAGATILLERIPFIWKHLSFTHKVTARNIFRYKKRMFMTIFGVAGSVAMLFTGLAVQHSIAGINDRQFGDLVHYDLIVAHNNYVPHSQQKQITALLGEPAVKEHTQIHYDTLTKVAGKNGDTQQIKLIVPADTRTFSHYIRLVNRQSQQKLPLTNDGVVISERLANLLGARVGDTITLRDSSNTAQRMRVSGITEMYMGHFAFMSPQAYRQVFHTAFQTNADLVNLHDRGLANTRWQAAKFIALGGVAGVVQNTTLRSQITTIVNALDKIMLILILVAGALAVVILYNLTNINVSERMRELSTIKVLGFYDNEVTMYIYRETIVLSLIGVLVGYGIGELLHQYILVVVPPDEVMFNPALGPLSFVLPFAVVAVITVFLGFFVNRRLKNVDMLEALKSVD
ncbi:FtsX-like permease family protein [Schleiferilactobacillus shenzhenensis]|uniref:ABC3 transporter permease C-terminal domain-containing protein n=1 Tax=Schleiferilactobacillus shenzhenensis LY-73 TaxID=1231336 RepID=U4TLL2_9LACO|nr:FtsX-like permease family protein [Schleiferilactobacillus shenzhenensis]ERL65756.1 hypothetical protein L248_2442 [Schleiferilactobacillus shenzhenensis LY-73]